jgi:hypothetical protein
VANEEVGMDREVFLKLGRMGGDVRQGSFISGLREAGVKWL